MSDTLSSQITDSITQANSKVLGDAPAIAMGNLFMATSQALSNAAHNATTNQQQSYVTAQAAATEAITTMLSVDTAVTSVAARKALDGASAASVAPAPPSPAALPDAVAATPDQTQALSAAAFAAAKASADPMLVLMVLDAGALALFNAVAHLQRTAVLAEAATAMALTRALAEPQDDLWKEVLAASERTVTQATDHLASVARLAVDMARDARA